jgi:hypothetical protein
VEFDPGAEEELLEALLWYEARSEGLGAEFLRQAKIQEARLTRTPLVHAIDYADIRRAFLGKFPYSLHFRIEDECVRVLACIHQSRDPKRWPGA